MLDLLDLLDLFLRAVVSSGREERECLRIGIILCIPRARAPESDKLFKSFSLKSTNFERSGRIFKTNTLLSIKYNLFTTKVFDNALAN